MCSVRFTRRLLGFRLPSVPPVALLFFLIGPGPGGGAARGQEPQEPPPSVVFVSRELDARPGAEGRVQAVERARRGRLLVREPDGSVRALVDATLLGAAGAPLDVQDPDVSFDGKRVVFSGLSPRDGAFRIYEVGADGSGLRQITRSDRQTDLSRYGEAAERLKDYDDLDPCYLPDGRICFVSTRYPGIAPDGRARATNLYVVGSDGSGLHRITTERFGGDTPAVDPRSGRIVYSRWWRTAQVSDGSAGSFAPPNSTVEAPPPPPLPPSPAPPAPPPPIAPGSPDYRNAAPPVPPAPPIAGGPTDPGTSSESGAQTVPQAVLAGIPDEKFPGVNSWFLSSIEPDGNGLSMWSGVGLDREATQAYRPSFLPDGRVLALFLPETPFLGVPGRNGLRLLERGPDLPEALGGPQAFRQAFRPGGGPGSKEADGFLYQSAAAMPDGRILVSARPKGLADHGDYDLFLRENGTSPLVPFFGFPGSAELDAVPLVGRPLPPVIPDAGVEPLAEEAPRSLKEAFQAASGLTFLCENIHFNAPVDWPIPSAPPVGQDLSIEFYTSPQRTGVLAADAPILIRRSAIGPGGQVRAELPAGVPLFEVLRRPDGSIPVSRDGQIFHVGGLNFGGPGQLNRCVGCHAGHSLIEVPQDASWTNLAPSALVTASSVLVLPTESGPLAFRPEAAVDRRTDPVTSEWAAGRELESRLELRWPLALRGSEVVLYAPRPGEGRFGVRNQVLWSFTLATRLKGALVEERNVAPAIPTRITRVELDRGREFDSLTITLRSQDTSGLFEGRRIAALAEVEVIAQLPRGDGPRARIAYLRGDPNNDGRSDLSDVVAILDSLFLGTGDLACAAAGDANSDDELNLSDLVHLLDFAFQGGAPPGPPFPECGEATQGALECGSTCP